MARERRVNKRMDIKVDVDVEHESKLQKLYSTNLSKGGVYLATDKLIPIGSKISLSFQIKELKKKFSANAVVIHHHEYKTFEDESTLKEYRGMGLRFTDLSEKDQEIIDKFILGKELKKGV